jgi:AcrR family transcriptional regulator
MDEDEHYMPRWGPMFSKGSLAKPDLATDVAIPLMAEGGWGALTLRNMASVANVTPQAIAAWFPSVAAMRVAIAERYGQRWIRQRGQVANHRIVRAQVESITPPQVALALLPETWLETVYDRVWLAVVEAGRWDHGVGLAVATIEEQERDLVFHLMTSAEAPERPVEDVDLALALTRGARIARTAVHDPLTAERATAALRVAVSGGRRSLP